MKKLIKNRNRFFGVYNKYKKKKKKNIKFNFQNNRLNTTNLTGELCKIRKDKIICTIENIIIN